MNNKLQYWIELNRVKLFYKIIAIIIIISNYYYFIIAIIIMKYHFLEALVNWLCWLYSFGLFLADRNVWDFWAAIF